MGKIIQFPPPTRDNERDILRQIDASDEGDDGLPQIGYNSAGQQSGSALKSAVSEEDGNDPETGPENILDLIASMPNCISRKITAQILATFGFLVAGFAILLAFKSMQSIFFFLVAGWIVWNVVLTVDDYRAGRIVEQAVVCVSVKSGLARKTTRVVMRTANEETPSYYEFCMAGRQAKEFTPNKVYIIYTKEYMPQCLFAYQEL